MASAGNYAGGSDGGGFPGARRRRVDDVRQLQQRRRGQVLHPVVEQHQQPHEERSPMQDGQMQQQQRGHYVQSDAYYDMPPSAPSGSGASTSRSPSSTRSGSTRSSRLSAKRQNMMARRIEIRRRNEERQQQQLQEQQLRELQQQQRQQAAARVNQHRFNDGQGQAVQQQQGGVAQGQSQPRHFHQQQQSRPMMLQQQRYHSDPRRSPDFNAPQYQHFDPSQADSNQPRQGQQNYDQRPRPPVQQQQQQMQQNRPASQVRPVQQQQYYHSQSSPQYNQQSQQVQVMAHHNQFSRAQTHESPMTIPSPPMLQRKQPQYAQIPIYHNNNTMGGENINGERRANSNQVYNQAELEQSGIIRNSDSGRWQPTNRLKKISPHDSPSDEWRGLNAAQRFQDIQKQQQAQHYQQQQPQQSMPQLQPRTPQQHLQEGQLPPRQNAQMRRSPVHQKHPGYVQHQSHQHPGYVQHQSQTGQNTQIRQSHDQSAGHQVPQNNPHEIHKQPQYPQDQQPHPQYQNQNQPNWNDINQQYHDDNRQRVYQRQLASRQQYQQEREHTMISPEQMEPQPAENPQQRNSSQSRSPHRSTHMSMFSPVEHLGNRTDQIQRKNNFVSSTNNQHHQLQHQEAHDNNEGEESIISVSEQARKFEKQARRMNPSPSNLAPGPANSTIADEETISVASLRKGWEGKTGSRQDQRKSKPSAAPSSNTQPTKNSPFGVWEERANRLARLRRREQRREQKKNIEDRWMNHRQNNVKSLPPPEKRQGGYQSEGERRTKGRTHRAERVTGPVPYAGDGYQSEGQELIRGRNRYHDGYQTEGTGNRDSPMDEGQEVEYDPDAMLEVEYDPDAMLDVETDAITPSDARRRLWDQNERLRAWKANESFDSMGDVRDRWPEQSKPQNNHGSPSHLSGIASPSNYSSSTAGGRFKSKFVHAAALATQRRANISESNDEGQQQPPKYSHTQRAREQQVQQQQQERDYDERLENQQEHQFGNQYMAKQDRQSQPHHGHQSQQHDYSSKKGLSHKNNAVSSHYTDSTAETTADITATPTGSYGSHHRHAAMSAAAVQQESSNAVRSTNNHYARKVTPSPPKRPSAQAMPPIAEQGVPAMQPPPSQAQNSSSVAELIARINAVSRSNPEEALAAIDSIINRERVNDGNGSGSPPLGEAVSRIDFQLTQPRPPLASTSSASRRNSLPFSPSRDDIRNPSATNRVESNETVVKHLGKDFFQEKYEDVLRNDSDQVLRDPLQDKNGANVVASYERQDDEDFGEDDDDDSLLSSDESTVSSMTDPTYQSLRSDQVRPRKSSPPAMAASQQRADGYPRNLPVKPNKSWNTLKREYAVRKSPPRSNQDSNEGMKKVVTAATSSSDGDIGLDSFDPDGAQQQRRFDEYQRNPNVKHWHQGQPQGRQQDLQHVQIQQQQQHHHHHQQQQQQRQQPPKPKLTRSGTNDFSMGICGVNYLGITKSDSRQSQMSSGVQGGVIGMPPSPETPSTLTDAWLPNAKSSSLFVNTNHKNRGIVAQQGITDAPLKRDSQNVTDAAPPRIPSSQLKPRPTQPNRINMPKVAMTPEDNQNVPRKRASTPEIMMAVSDAFSNVDISLEGTWSQPPSTVEKSHPIQPSQDYDPPLQHLTSSKGEDEEDPIQSLHTISEAFSDVDVSFEQEKTVSQRRKELEYLAKSWTASQSNSNEESGGSSTSHKLNQTQAPKAAVATWAHDPKKATGDTTNSKKNKKRTEPTLRLKGNKSLAKKFASLVKAYDD